MTTHILLPKGFTARHHSLVLAYVRGKETIPGADWPHLMEAFDLLHNAAVMIDRERRAFPTIYHELVEDHYAARFIEQLYTLTDVEIESARLRAAVVRAVIRSLQKADYLDIVKFGLGREFGAEPSSDCSLSGSDERDV